MLRGCRRPRPGSRRSWPQRPGGCIGRHASLRRPPICPPSCPCAQAEPTSARPSPKSKIFCPCLCMNSPYSWALGSSRCTKLSTSGLRVTMPVPRGRKSLPTTASSTDDLPDDCKHQARCRGPPFLRRRGQPTHVKLAGAPWAAWRPRRPPNCCNSASPGFADPRHAHARSAAPARTPQTCEQLTGCPRPAGPPRQAPAATLAWHQMRELSQAPPGHRRPR
jgi:hypothetical protein